MSDGYAAIQAVNFSTLKHAAKSAAHYRHALAVPDGDTPGRAKGRLTHAALLDPDSLLRDFVTYDGDRRGKAWAAFCEQHPDKTIVKLEEYEAAVAQRDAVRAHPVAGPIFASAGKREHTITWRDEETGLDCKGRLDFLQERGPHGGPTVWDLKGCPTTDAAQFGANAARQLYHAQLAFYVMGLRANGIEARAGLVGVEFSPPWDVAVFTLTDDDLWAGETLCRDLLCKVAAGRFSGAWPGRYPEAQPLRLPAWAFPAVNEVDQGLDLLVSAAEG
jgi:hypothetical protein